VGGLLTRSVGIPTIGIGAGPECDGQILVIHDLLGLSQGSPPRFVRRYADLSQAMRDAVRAFAADVRAGAFPAERESYATPPDVEASLARHRERGERVPGS
jgi:3-methyl-2-oxobutanoate hydroxymethyltransferase